jgi:hypothetical protein
VQCIYCQQVRAKNTSRQKQHLQECPNLQTGTGAPVRQASSPSDQLNGQNAHSFTSPPNLAHTGPMTNGSASHNTPMQGTPLPTMPARPMMSQTPTLQGSSSTPMNRPLQALQTPKTTQSSKKSTPTSNLPAPPLDDVHAAFVECMFCLMPLEPCLSPLWMRSQSAALNPEIYTTVRNTRSILTRPQSVQKKKISVYQFSASTATRFVQRTPVASVNIFSSAQHT